MEWEVIHTYTRAQAIEDEVLVDVTETAKEAGFRIPVALTAAVWAGYVRVPEGVEGQDEAGRLWDILWMLRYEISRTKRKAAERSRVRFQLYVRNNNQAAELVTIKAECGPGDEGEPVLTVLQLDED